MSTPHCGTCGRWDGTHSGGCPRTSLEYRCPSTWQQMPTQPVLRCERWNGHTERTTDTQHWNLKGQRQWVEGNVTP